MQIAVLAVASVATIWLLFSSLNPVWRLYESWPRTIDGLELHAKCDGLLRFGLPGAHWTFTERTSGDVISIVKTSPPGQGQFQLRINASTSPHGWKLVLDRGMTLALAGAGSAVAIQDSEAFHLSCSASARLEAVIRVAAKSLGHHPRCRYRTSSDGPVDYSEVDEYFGLR